MEQQGKIHGNKPREKLDLNLENVTGNVITLDIAKREFMYGWDICKNPEGYTWNKFTTTILKVTISTDYYFFFEKSFVSNVKNFLDQAVQN